MNSTPFLKEIAGILLQPGAYNLHETCIVFPNKRARLYLSKYIGELTEVAVWAPQYLTITELMESMTGYYIADRLTLVFELYNAYRKITGSAESFDSFYPYSETLLADFDEIDKYLVDANDLFQNLADLKSIDGRFNYLSDEQLAHIRRFWQTFDPENSSSGQSVFISLWESLSAVYHEFKNRLESRQMAYEGMAYRKALETLDEQMDSKFPENKFVIIGFNALNACEDKLFSRLKSRGQAEFFWDYDSWYTNNGIHEAGYFMRNNLTNFPQVKVLDHDHLTIDKENILFVPVSSNSGQAMVLSNIFERLSIREPAEIENSALVLADEGLLLSALYAIPDFINDINVTMGYPLAGSAMFSLIDSLFELNRNARSTSVNKQWYFKDVMALMSNPLLKNWYGETVEKVRMMIQDRHLTYLNLHDIAGDSGEDLIFKENPYPDTCRYLLDIVTEIIRQLPGGSKGMGDPVQVELLFQVYTFLTRLQDVIKDQQFEPGSDIMFKLIRKMLRNMHIPFSGEPLAGLQVLGILETRTLDFKNVIVLSANEGILPKSSDKPSFIPHNLRVGFGMPTPEHHDAIYAYYFYRLIQRARNIALIYDASSAGMRTGERSRFLHQIHYEMKLPVTEVIFGSSIMRIPVKPVIIPKTGDVEKALKMYFDEGGRILSPSAINEFLNCPVRFYFHHIAGLPQPEEITEEIDARQFGNLLHSTLKLIYEAFGHLVVTHEKLEAILKDESIINCALDKAFDEVLYGNKTGTDTRKPEGFNIIVRQVIYSYARQFIKAELNSCPFTVEELEERHHVLFPVSVDGKTVHLKIGGIIDRIDRQEGRIRILDYKTGGIKDRFSTVESLFDAGEKLRNDAVFQVLLYALVYQKIHHNERILPGLFFLRQSYEADFSPFIQFGPKKEPLTDFNLVQPEFEDLLRTALENLFDKKIPFTQTGNLKVCQYCPYAMICRKETRD